MPTNNPRLTITLEPKLAAQLRKLSELTGNSQSNLITTLLDTQGPVFDRLIRVLEAADAAKESLKGHQLADQMKEAQERIEKQFGLALDHFDEVTDDLLKDAETIKRRKVKSTALRSALAPARRAAPVASAVTQTPPSNRGVRSTQPSAKVRKSGRGDGSL